VLTLVLTPIATTALGLEHQRFPQGPYHSERACQVYVMLLPFGVGTRQLTKVCRWFLACLLYMQWAWIPSRAYTERFTSTALVVPPFTSRLVARTITPMELSAWSIPTLLNSETLVPSLPLCSPASGSGLLTPQHTWCVLFCAGRYGFVLPPSEIIPTGEESFAAVRVFADYVVSHTN